MTPEMQVKINIWRQKCNDGTATVEEMQEAIMYLRQNRTSASQTGGAKKSSAKKPTRSADDLLNELDNIK